MSGSISAIAAATVGRFQVANGQVLDPAGKVFTPKGIAISPSQMGDANQVLADFPGLNFVRLVVVDYQSPDTYAAFINTMTSHGIVVEFEDHTSSDGVNGGGGRGIAYTGQLLTNELDWYSSIARAYASNPYVWFGTDNEPPIAGLSTWEQQTYNAIRNTGNSNPIMMQLPGGGYPDGQSLEAYGMDPSVYLPMRNVLVDIHLYGWSSDFVPDQQVVTSALAALVRGGQSMTTVDGHVPVVIGEYGISTEGEAPDANANQVLQVAQHSNLVIGAVAFTWSGSGPDTLTDGQGHLTSYGQEVAQWIASGSQSANFAVTNQTKGSSSFEAGQTYVGPVAGLEKEFALITPDNLNITATVPNVFIRTGSGMDGINVSQANGNNILDGSTGSNFLIGGAGNDTFYIDNRNPNSPIFSTIVNFHAGDNATVWGVNATDFTMLKLDHQGAIGATGLDLLFAAPGHTDTSFVLAGYTSADLTNGRLSLSYGKTQDIPGLPGSEYLTVHAN